MFLEFYSALGIRNVVKLSFGLPLAVNAENTPFNTCSIFVNYQEDSTFPLYLYVVTTCLLYHVMSWTLCGPSVMLSLFPVKV